MFGGLSGSHIEDDPAWTSPGSVPKMKQGAAVANGAHRIKACHIAAFYRFEPNVHGRECRDKLIRRIDDNSQRPRPFTASPCQTARRVGLSSQSEKVGVEFRFEFLKLRHGTRNTRRGGSPTGK